MDGMIKCPVCGENNSTDLEFCQNCQSRLQPLTGPLKGVDAPLTPGQLPTKKKNTAELEPILPQWLRDARSQARESSQDDGLTQGMQQSKTPSLAEPSTPNVDFLAGLSSQAADDNDDETPDWLASITGVSNKSKKTDSEPTDVRWVEMGGKDDFMQDAPAENTEGDAPSWLASIQSQPKTEKDELTDWFKEAANSEVQNSSWLDEPAKNVDFNNEISTSVPSDDTPDWLRQMDADDSAKSIPPKSEPTALSDDDLPAWLQQSNAQPPVSDAPAWLNAIDSEEKSQPLESAVFSEPAIGGDDASFLSTEETPDWLKDAQPEQPKSPPLKGTSPLWLREDLAGQPAEAEVPSWLSSDAPLADQPLPEEIKQDDAEFGDIPNWLKAAAPQSSIFSEPAVEPNQSFSSDDAPDWLAAFKAVETPQTPSPFENDAQVDDKINAPAFTENSFDTGTADALFTEMPDWLSNVPDDTAASNVMPAAATSADSIAPSELPSWVQAMRPVDGGVSQATRSSGDQTLESQGALSGLQGVLPSVPGYTPSSKPKAYSILLQATEEQQSHALLLEQILAAEAEPQPIASYAPLAASRPLRWFITLALLLVIIAMTALPAPVFSMPSMNATSELKGALDVAQNVPEGAPVLVVMDYHPSRAAELEVAAAPMLDQMDLLRHPRLFFISTNEMGPILAERLVSLPTLQDRYQGEGQFTNLGYLPGGELGIRAFVKNPLLVMPSDVNGIPSPLQPNGISINQFVAIVVMTDNADSARIWIEQTTAEGSPTPMVFVTSAQAGPMIRPYYISHQVEGIVDGLHGGAIFEQNNAGRPGTARGYWDAYSFGMFAATMLTVLGGLWNLALGARDRSMAREAK